MKRVLLIGQPNVGKSTLLNALTGSKVQISNYPGTTVELFKSSACIDGVEYEFVDTPGIYNLYPSSLEEKVTERVILEGNYDAIILIIDATAIERGLAQAVAVAELGVPLLIAINFWEEAESKGIFIDVEGLERDFGVPVIRINPLKREGILELKIRLKEAKPPKLSVKYDDHIEKAIGIVVNCLKRYRSKLSLRGLAVRLIEGDPLVCSKFPCREVEEVRRRLRTLGYDPYNDIEITRTALALLIAKRKVKLISVKKFKFSKLDLYLMSNVSLGIIFSLGLVLSLVVITVYAGSFLINFLDDLLSPYIRYLLGNLGSRGLLNIILSKSIEALYVQYIAAVPYVFIFYLLLILLEDSGILARMMIWMYSFTKRIGMHPKGIIPMLLGMGCSVPATRASRIMPGLKQKVLAITTLAFIPCSSRASIIFAVVGRTLGPLIPVIIYIVGFIITILTITVLSRVLKARDEAVMIEDIPPLRHPKLRNILFKTWIRLKDFITVVTPLVIAGAVAYTILSYYKFDMLLLDPLAPIAKLLGLPLKAFIPIIYGFLQKDLVISMLYTTFGTMNLLSVMSPQQIITFTILSSYQVPCIIALGSMIKELGVKRAIELWISLDTIGFLAALVFSYLSRMSF